MSILDQINDLKTACEAPGGQDEQGMLPSAVLAALMVNLEHNSSFTKLGDGKYAPAGWKLTLVVQDLHGNQFLVNGCSVHYPHGGLTNPVFVNGTNHAVELFGNRVTHYAIELYQLPAPIPNEGL